jgi:predicted NACHT family NTPase
MIALIRDIPGGEDGDVVTLILRTLRHRYGLDMTMDALQVALQGGHVFAVLDGLDELADRGLRKTVVTSIRAFAAAYPKVPLLVTSRPYLTLSEDLPGFRAVTIRPWSSETSEKYLAALLTHADTDRSPRAAGELLRVAAESGILSGPLALQMLVVHYRRHRRLPATSTELIEMFIVDTIEAREASRGTLYFPPALLRRLLEAVAFAMQSDDANRVTIGYADVVRALRRVTPPGSKEVRAEVVLSGFADRTGLLREIGDWNSPGSSVFAFTHTVYREHLAGAYLARKTAKEVAAAIVEHAADASWEAVLRGALEMRDADFAEQVIGYLRRRHPELSALVQRWASVIE